MNGIALRERYKRTFAKNTDYFEREAAGESAPDLSKRDALLGSLCLSTFHDLTVLYAADQIELLERLLPVRAVWIREAYSRYIDDVSLDERGIDRLEIALACDAGRMLERTLFVEPSVPFEAIRSAVESGELDSEASTLLACLWSFYSYYRGMPNEYRAALGAIKKIPKCLRKEVGSARSIENLASSPNARGWTEFEDVLKRWVEPEGPTNTAADDYQQAMRVVLALLWCRFRLERISREALLRTFLAEFQGDQGQIPNQ